MNRQPQVSVGILTAQRIGFVLHGDYTAAGKTVAGENRVSADGDRVRWDGASYGRLRFEPCGADASFTLKEVVIGIGFHWQRTEDQVFRGALELIADDGRVTAVNRIGVEEYLVSVIASEMNASASPELLKAHAVISRSWLLAQIVRRQAKPAVAESKCIVRSDDEERIRWYDREDHLLFDVCADDHCQRYQGITRTYEHAAAVRRAVADTCGEVLTYGGEICVARFSKCCGGVTEEFRNCWEERDYPYLSRVRDCDGDPPAPDLTREDEAARWIGASAEAFCNTSDPGILGQVLNGYDCETSDFYRWRVEYTPWKLSDLVRRRLGIDLGAIRELIPVQRGASGRLVKLRIVGTQGAVTIGKELEIRRVLSESHLYSSAFVVEKTAEGFILRGAGWGHGVGLCQIGAAVMGHRGFAYDRILLHYYRGAAVEKYY